MPQFYRIVRKTKEGIENKTFRALDRLDDQTVAGTSLFQATALVGVPIGLPA